MYRHLGKCNGNIHAVQLVHDARVVVFLGSGHGSGREEKDGKSLVVHCDESLLLVEKLKKVEKKMGYQVKLRRIVEL